MDKATSDTKSKILRSACSLFFRQGFARVSVDEIADLAGVTKRTIYYHFQSKDDIASVVLEVQHRHVMAEFEKWMEPSPDTAADVVANLFSKLKVWADGPDWVGSGYSRISAELADLRGHPAKRAASRHKETVELLLARNLSKAGAPNASELARQIMVLIEGGMSLALIHGDTGYISAASSAAERLVMTPP